MNDLLVWYVPRGQSKRGKIWLLVVVTLFVQLLLQLLLLSPLPDHRLVLAYPLQAPLRQQVVRRRDVVVRVLLQ